MRLRNNFVMLALAVTGGCAGGWQEAPPGAGSALPPASGYPAAELPPAGELTASELGNAGPDDTARSTPPPQPAYTPSAGYPAQRVRDSSTMPPPPSTRYDGVGYAVWSAEGGTIAAAHPTLPVGSFAEVTALDSGRTVLVPITAQSRPGREIALTGAAARALGFATGGTAAVRVRAANATGADIVALKAGQAPPARPDTPPVLLNALRAKLNGTLGQAGPEPARPAPVATRAPVRPAPVARPAVTPARTSAGATGYYIQVAAVADAARARSVAQAVGGSMSLANGLYRVRFGPFDDLRTAQAARDEVAGRGYGDARIVRQD